MSQDNPDKYNPDKYSFTFSDLEALSDSAEELPKSHEDDVIDAIPYSSVWSIPLFHWRTLFIVLGLSLGLLYHWISTSELFETPQDILVSRRHFTHAKEHYLSNSSYWNAKLQQLL
jgi:hypothetical protein